MKDHIRDWSPSFINSRIDRKTLATLEEHKDASHETVEARLKDIDCEVDVMSAKLASVVGLGLGLGALAFWNKGWKNAPLIGFAALVVPKVAGFDPLLFVMRLFGFRSTKEIEREQHALKTLRGDFHRFEMDPTPKGALTSANGEVGIESSKPSAKSASVRTSHGLEQHPI